MTTLATINFLYISCMLILPFISAITLQLFTFSTKKNSQILYPALTFLVPTLRLFLNHFLFSQNSNSNSLSFLHSHNSEYRLKVPVPVTVMHNSSSAHGIAAFRSVNTHSFASVYKLPNTPSTLWSDIFAYSKISF